MKKTVTLFLFLLSIVQAQGQFLRDDFNRAATTDIAGSLKWRRVLNLNDTSATIQLNADSTISPRNLLGPFNRGAAYWDSALTGRFQVGMILRHKNGNDGIPSFHLQVMNDSSWTTGDGYALRYPTNPTLDRMDLQRIAGIGTDTPNVSLLATLNREFAEGDTIVFKIYQDGRKTAVVYGVAGARDSISVVDTVYQPASWRAWIQGRVFSDPIRMDNFMIAPIPWRISATAGPGGSIFPQGSILTNPGAAQSFTVTPTPGFAILDVKVDSVSVGAVGGHTFSSVNESHTIEAFFDTAEYTITATASAGGSISPSGSVAVSGATDRTFTITPDTGFHIDSVVVDGANQGTGGSYTFVNITANHSIDAYFSINTYTIAASATGGGSITPSGAVGVTHGADQSFTITPDTGYHVDSVVVDGANQGALTSYPFTNVTAGHAIAAYFAIDTYTISATAGAGGSITPSGPVSVNHGADQSFTITPNTGFHIDSVVVDGANQGAITSFPFTNVTAGHTIAAWFTINTYTITASAAAGGSITPSGSVSVNHGADQSFTITPDTGFHVDSVVVDGANQGAVTSYPFTNVTTGHTIAAYFTINSYTITASLTAGGSISPSGSVSVTHGAAQSFTISPNTGFHIDSVVVDGSNQGAITSFPFTNVTAGHTIAAYFSINKYTITASAAAGGTISPSGSVLVNHGASQSFTITPNTGFHIDSVVVDGANQGALTSYPFTNVTAGHTIAAYFTINTYTITATASAGGTISPAGAVGVTHGGSQSFTITPNTGFHIDSVVVDGANQGAVTSFPFNNVTAGHTIAAYFRINSYTITASASAGGSISPSGAVSVTHGGSQAFTITPNTGFHIDSVVVDGSNQGAITSFPFTNVTTGHTIAAFFTINKYTITATAAAGGAISPSGSVLVNHGASQSFTITPNTGFHIDSVVVDGANQGALTSYPFTNVTTGHTIAAYFTINTYTITATASVGGTISPSGAVGVTHGGSRSFTITPNTGFHIDSVVVDGANQGVVTSFPFTNVTTGHTIAAYFRINSYTITASASAGGSISPSGAVSVTHGGSQSFTITPNTGFHVDSVVVDGSNQGAITSFPFTNVTAAHSIAAYFSINKYTITATAAAGGTITPSGSVLVNHGAAQSFTISANTGFHIDSVVVDGSNQGAITSFPFSNVTANHTIAAYFTINTYTITATASAGGSISPSGSVGVTHGGSQSFTITPNTGFHIDSVVVDGANQGAITSFPFSNVTAGHTIAAYFRINSYTITASASAGGTISPSGSVSVNHGGSQSFTITPNTGFHVDSVVVDGSNQGAITSFPFTNVTAGHTIAAFFTINSYTITATADAGGSISPSGSVSVNHGGSRSFTITPNTGFHIDSVVVDGSNQGAVTSYPFTNVTTGHTIAAWFTINTYTITATASAGGSISPSGAVGVTHGGSQSFTVTPNTGFHIDSVVVDGSNQGALTSYPFTNVTAGHTIAAYFSIDTFTITASASTGGTITPSGAVTVNYGANRSFAIAPNTGYHIDSVVVDGANQGAIAAYQFDNVTAAHAIAAYFSINIYTVTAGASSGGSISPFGVINAGFGDDPSFTIAPNTGSHIDSVVVDGVDQGFISSYTFTDISANHVIQAYFSINAFTITATAGTGGSITPAGVIGVNFGANRSFTISPNSNYHIDSVVVDGANQGAITNHTFTNVVADHVITAWFTINSYTIAASASAGGSITPAGPIPVNHGASQSFAITPNSGYHIDSVVVDGANQGAVTSYPFTNVTAGHTIAAYFTIDTHTITASATAGGSISPSGVVEVTDGGAQSFAITPNSGYHIDSVVVDGANQGAIATYPFTNVTAGHTISAFFTINAYTISATASAGGTISPSGPVPVNHGADTAFTISPNAGYHIDSVVVDGANQGAIATYPFTNVTAGHTISAFFTINAYTISAAASAGGTISPSGPVSVTHGGSQSFAITADSGYHIDSVVVDGANQGAISSYPFTNVTAGHTIAAYFTINAYTITATASAGGTISPSGAVGVDYGADTAFTISPNTGYHIDSIVVDGSNQGAVTTYPFTNVTAGHTIAAWFSIDAYTITATASAGGSISPAGAVGIDYGADTSFTITPNTGYHIDSVVVDGTNQGAVTSYPFTNVTTGHTIAAYFSINAYTITATASAGGTISPTGVVGVSYAGAQSFAITPGTGYHVDSVVVDGVNQGALASYPFSNVTANHAIAAWFSINSYAITASASAGGSIAPSGTVSVTHGDSLSFALAADTGFHIDSVVVDGQNQGAVGSFDFNSVTAGHSIAAWFSINSYTITATASAGGTISPAGAVGIDHGADTAFTISPNTGYHLDSVVVDGASQGAITTYSFTNVTTGHAIGAYFSLDVLTITATAGTGGTISPSGSVGVGYGSDQAFTIVPAEGRHVDSVIVDGVNRGAVTAWQFDSVTTTHAIAAHFSINIFAITAVQAPNGSITPAGATPVIWGDSAAYAIVPDTGYYVTALHVDTATIAAAASYTFTDVQSNHSISASFAIRTFTINATSSAGGSVSPQGAVTASWGDTLVIDVNPDVGHHVDSVVVDGVNLGQLTTYSFEDVTSGHTLTAWFSIDVFTIAATAGTGGTISPSGNVPVAYGAVQSFTITPSVGYKVDSVLVDGANAGAVTSHNFTFVTAPHSIAAWFSLRTFHVVSTAGSGGEISPLGSTLVTWGDSLAYTITPDTGYHIDSVVVDGVNSGNAPAYVFRNIATDHFIESYFSETAYTIAASASGTGTISPSGVVGVAYAGGQLFTMSPSAGCHVDSVLVDGVNIGAPATYRFVNVTASHTIAAHFSINYYTITATAGAGGTISPSGGVTLVHGSSQLYSIAPSTGYRIQNVLVDGISVGQPASWSFTNLAAGHTIAASFTRITYSISATPGPNGALSPAGSSTVAWGDSITYVITPDPGYYIQGVAVDGSGIGTVSSYTFSNVTANHYISATFTSNATPTAFTLVGPVDGIRVPPAALRALRFAWRKSFDANPGDVLKYVMTLTGPNVNFSSFELTDTAVTLDLRGLAIVNNALYRWTVRVNDGTVTVASPDTFDITVDPTTAVDDGTGRLPVSYALGQNYPNPFNPTTSLPFDLPERSEVTLRIYNLIGAEVATIADGESLPAGSYIRNADFSGLPSGVYFCRMMATGETGGVFDKVVRLVLMR